MDSAAKLALGAQLQEVADYAVEAASRYRVAFLADIKGHTAPIDDYELQSITTEFYDLAEVDQIVSAIRRIGFEASVEFDLLALCADLLKMSPAERERLIVFSIAQNGTGPGRKAAVPAICQLLSMANTMSNPHAESLARHKWHTASILAHWGVAVPQTWCFEASIGWLRDRAPPEGALVIAKASFECASIGVTEQTTGPFRKEMEEKLEYLSRVLRQPIAVQEFIEGPEIEVGVLVLDKPLPLLPVEIRPHEARDRTLVYLDYNSVFDDQYSFHDLYEVSSVAADSARAAALNTAEVLGLSSVCRVDMRIPRDGTPRVIDISCCPDFRSDGSIAFGINALNLDHSDFIALTLASAIRRQEVNSRSKSECP